MQRIGDRLAKALLVVLGVALIGLVCLGIWNIFSRYVLGKAILWADEITVFGMIVMAWLGAIISAWQGSEIRMGIIADLLPKRVQTVIDIVQQAVIAALCFWVAWLSWGYVSRLFQFGMKSDAAQIPTWTVHVSVTIGLAFIALIALLRLAQKLFSRPPRLPMSED